MRKKRTLIISLSVGILVVLVLSVIIYSVLFWFVEFPVTNNKTINTIYDYCEKIKNINKFDDLNGGTLSTDLKMKSLIKSYTYLDNTLDNKKTEIIKNLNYRVILYYYKHNITKILFKDYNDEIRTMFGPSLFTFGYWISDNGEYVRGDYKGDNRITVMSYVKWQERILEDFYLYSPYDSDGKIPYLDVALDNIDKITKKAYVHTIYSSIENIDIEFSVRSVEDSLRFKLNVTEFEYDDSGRVILEKTIYYEFSDLKSYAPQE